MRTLQNKENDRHHTRAGTSITEALVSLVILALFIAGTSKLILSHRQLSGTTQDHYTAITIANNRLEYVRSAEFDRRPDFAETNTIIDERGNPAPLTGRFRRTLTVTHSTLTYNSEIVTYELTCQVEIRDRKTLEFEGPSETTRTYQTKHLSKK